MKEKCGVFGVYGLPGEASRLTYFGLLQLQHRGQESSGITASDQQTLRTHKSMGLVPQVYQEQDLLKLTGSLAIGHNRYSTSAGSQPKHCQPVTDSEESLALAHNGNLPTTTRLERFLEDRHQLTNSCNDSELMFGAIKYYLNRGAKLEDAITEAYPLLTGVFSMLVMTKDKVAAVRDCCGVRPLSIGTLNGGFVFSSETCAMNTINAKFSRDVLPGEMIVADQNGLTSYQLAKGQQKLDIFEFVYFSRPDSRLLGKSVYGVRKNFGVNLAKEYFVDADIVVPVPDSSIPAAIGYSQASGIPLEIGLVKNRYIGRTFIEPAQHLREDDVDIKHNPIEEVVAGKKVLLIEDSIVRGTTAPKTVSKLRCAGAAEVHFGVAASKIIYPDYYGIDTKRQDELIAARKSLEQIRNAIGADTLHYLSYEGLIAATELPEELFNTSCFTGVYPIDIGERIREISYAIR